MGKATSVEGEEDYGEGRELMGEESVFCIVLMCYTTGRRCTQLGNEGTKAQFEL